MKKYNIVTLDANALLKYRSKEIQNGREVVTYELDFTSSRGMRRYIKSTNLYDDTAMFYQIREVLGLKESESSENSLKEIMLFVDFEGIFRNSKDVNEIEEVDTILSETKNIYDGKDRIIRAMFDNGISIKYADNYIVTYMPFDKSASMSRKSQMSFIDKDVLVKLSPRLNLDIKFDEQEVILSKYYAYRGLYLSDADRVIDETLILDSEKVIVINDEKETISKNTCFLDMVTAILENPETRNWQIKEKSPDYFTIDKLFDGEGIVSFEYAEKIAKAINQNAVSSFQIRMPFIKGMLHKVDFKKFLREELEIEDSCEIVDAFGTKKDIFKAEIIIPVSMFKCYDWIKNFVEQQKIESSCMEFYFNKFKKYNHALYISNTDMPYGKTSLTKLSYQVLNTLDLESVEFDKIVKNHLNWAKNPVEYMRAIKSLPDEPGDNGYTTWQYALSKSRDISRETKIQKELKVVRDGLLHNCARGRLIVNGEVRFLSRDLLHFLIKLVPSDYENHEKYEWVKKHCLHKEEFYLPCNKIDLKSSKYYPIFRNPHLSRNEQCALKPAYEAERDNSFYRKYFSHLKGVIMVGSLSLVPNALGGADFDGDTVKVISDDNIRRAVLRGVYEKATKHKYKRNLRIIDIPSAKTKHKEAANDKISYRVIKDTFDNQIGLISNLSIKLGHFEYGEKQPLEHTCAECTILTGLEIDAAKSGHHPNLKKIIEYGNSKKLNATFDYIDFKRKIDDMYQNQYGIYKKMIDCDIDKGSYRIKKSGSSNSPAIITYDYDDGYHTVNKLPKYFLDGYLADTSMLQNDPKETKKKGYFDFLASNWKKDVKENDFVRSKVAAAISAYNQILRINNKYVDYKKAIFKTSFESYQRKILKMQYDSEYYEYIVNEQLYDLWSELDSEFDSFEKVTESLKRLQNSCWPFLMESERSGNLDEILGFKVSKDSRRLLTNFNCRGYNLLFYVLKDIEALRAEELTAQKVVESEITKSDDRYLGDNGSKKTYFAKPDESLYKRYRDEWYQKYIELLNTRTQGWRKIIFEACNTEVQKFLSEIEDSDTRFMVLYSLRGANNPDKDSEFFWRNITVEDIDRHIVATEEATHVG